MANLNGQSKLYIDITLESRTEYQALVKQADLAHERHLTLVRALTVEEHDAYLEIIKAA